MISATAMSDILDGIGKESIGISDFDVG